jgi:ADP-ribose pyrophosphatase YjhB (NUDIX family)
MTTAHDHEFSFCPLCGGPLTMLESGHDRGRMACGKGHFVHYDNPAVTALAFVERDGRYLVLERAQEPYRGLWDLPGGFIESGESPAEAVRREIFEETGLIVDAPIILGAYTSRYGDGGKPTVDIAFHCQEPLGEVRLSDESSGSAWVTVAGMPTLAFAGERSAFGDLKRRVCSS